MREIIRRVRVKNLDGILGFIYFLTEEKKCNYTINMRCGKNLWGAGRMSLVDMELRIGSQPRSTRDGPRNLVGPFSTHLEHGHSISTFNKDQSRFTTFRRSEGEEKRVGSTETAEENEKRKGKKWGLMKYQWTTKRRG